MGRLWADPRQRRAVGRPLHGRHPIHGLNTPLAKRNAPRMIAARGIIVILSMDSFASAVRRSLKPSGHESRSHSGTAFTGIESPAPGFRVVHHLLHGRCNVLGLGRRGLVCLGCHGESLRANSYVEIPKPDT